MTDAMKKTRVECDRQTEVLLKAFEQAANETAGQFDCPMLNALASALVQFEAATVNSVPAGPVRSALKAEMRLMRKRAFKTVPGSGVAGIVTIGGPEARH